MEYLPTLSCDEKEMSGAWMRMSNDLDSLIRVRRSTSGADECGVKCCVCHPPVCNNDIEALVLYIVCICCLFGQ